MVKLDAKIPSGPIQSKWTDFKSDTKLVNPANKRKYHRHRRRHRPGRRVGRGDAGRTRLQRRSASASRTAPAAPTRIAAQGGINAAKNYQNDGDSVYRLFYDTIKGGDFRAARGQRPPPRRSQRQHHRPVRRPGRAVRPRVRRPPRQPLVRRRAGVAHVLLPRPDGAATAARRVPGAVPADRLRQGQDAPAHRDARPRRRRRPGARHRRPRPGHRQDRVVLGRRRRAGHGRLLQRLLPLHERGRLQRHGHLPRVQARGGVRQPVLHADSPDLHSGQRRPPVEADADERVAAQRRPRVGAEEPRPTPPSTRRPVAEGDRDYFLERIYPSFGNLAPRDVVEPAGEAGLRRGAGGGAGHAGVRGVYLDFASAIKRDTKAKVQEKYGNLFEMYERITGESGYDPPMRIYPALHYTMGGLWVDYYADVERRGAVRRRRGQLLGPRGESPRRECPHAGTRRRLLRAAVHPRQLLRRRPRRKSSRPTTPNSSAARRRCASRCKSCWPSRGRRRPSSFTAKSARSCGTTWAWRGRRRRASTPSSGFARSARSSGTTSTCRGLTRT